MSIFEAVKQFGVSFSRTVLFRFVTAIFLLGVYEHILIIIYSNYDLTPKSIKNISYGIAYDLYMASLAGLILIILFFLPAILKKVIAVVILFAFSFLLYIDFSYFLNFGTHVSFSNIQYFQDIGDFKSSLLHMFGDVQFYIFALVLPCGSYFYLRHSVEEKRLKKQLLNHILYFLILLIVGGVPGAYSNSAFSKNFHDPVVSSAANYFFSNYDKGVVTHIDKPEEELAFVKSLLTDNASVSSAEFPPPDEYPLVRYEDYTNCQKNTEKSVTGEKLCNLFSRSKLPNIIFILLESFRATDLGMYGGDPAISKEFEELAKDGILFKNFYANGTRTRNGQVAVHCSLMPNYHPIMSVMRMYNKHAYDCLPQVLKRLGYETSFIIASNAGFDFQDVFFKRNGFDRIIDESDYPQNAEVLGWGYSDRELYHKMYEELKTAKQPFFMSALTITSHHPFDVPEAYQTGATDFEDKFLESLHYTSDQVNQFIRKIEKEPWYQDTLVFILADTSKPTQSTRHDHYYNRLDATERPEKRNHREYAKVEFLIPLLILGGRVPHGIIVEDYAGQIDLPPTIADIIGMRGYTHWAGRSLLVKPKNSWAFFNRLESNYSVISDQLLTMFEESSNGQTNLFEYGTNNSELRAFYRKAAHSWIKSQQWLLQEGKIWNREQPLPLELAK